MTHPLMVESWVGSMSRLLPRAIREGGHAFTFLTRDLHHYLRSAPEGTAHPLLGARHVITADTNDTDTLLPEIQHLHAVLRFDGVPTSCDYYLPAVARIAARLGLPGAARRRWRPPAARTPPVGSSPRRGFRGRGSPCTRSGPT